MYLRTLTVLQDLQKASPNPASAPQVEAEPPAPPADPAPEPAAPEQTQSLTPQIGFVLPTIPTSPEPPCQLPVGEAPSPGPTS
jgi:hypothetical protein